MQASTVTFFWLENEHSEQFKYQSSHQKWMLIVSTKQSPSPSHALASILGQWNDVLSGALGMWIHTFHLEKSQETSGTIPNAPPFFRQNHKNVDDWNK